MIKKKKSSRKRSTKSFVIAHFGLRLPTHWSNMRAFIVVAVLGFAAVLVRKNLSITSYFSSYIIYNVYIFGLGSPHIMKPIHLMYSGLIFQKLEDIQFSVLILFDICDSKCLLLSAFFIHF